MKGSQPTKDFDPGGDGNDYGGRGEVGSCVDIHAYCKYVVGSNNKPKKPDCYYGSDYSHVAKGLFLTGVVGDNMGDYPKPG